MRIQQRAPYDEVRGADGQIAYRDVRIAAARIREEWPDETLAAERPEKQESKATTAARIKQERENACLEALKERMRANPNDPVAKEKLRQDFPGFSARAFNQLFSQASRETGCVAWSKGGPRRRKTT
jgi:hypothetical protein